MYELLENLYHLTENHLKYKVKHADCGDREDEICDAILECCDKLYDVALDVIGDTETRIDDIMKEINERETSRVCRRRDYNVYMSRERGDL